MTRLRQLFTSSKKPVINIYCTAGYPYFDSTLEVIKALQEHGADIIELGIPFSDPLADGPIIQQSSARAIANGMTVGKLFRQLNGFREVISIPVILMGYLNPVLQYGFEKFCKDAASAGVDGLIIPDLPPYEFAELYGPVIRKYGLDFIFLVTPDTPDARVKKLDELSSGFLYAVAGNSTTGSVNKLENFEEYLGRLNLLNLSNPVLAGFGIKSREDVAEVSRFTRGAIIGSSYIQALSGDKDVNAATKSFLEGIL